MQQPVVNKSDAIRKDFSSPDIKSRGLKVQSGGESSSLPDPANRLVVSSSRHPPVGAGHMSSRARQGIAEKPTPESGTGGPRLGLGGVKSHPKGGSGGLREHVLHKGAPPKEDVAISKERYTKDDGTPRLGGRKLPGVTGRSNSMADLQIGAASQDNASKSDDDADLVTTKPTAQPTSAQSSAFVTPAPHSPLQLTANRTLLTIAGKGGSEGFTGKIGSESRTESPKPAFLRRLDSPLTNHGRLLQHKSILDKLLRRAKRAVPHISFEKYDTIRESLLQAVEYLEQSTTTTIPRKEGI